MRRRTARKDKTLSTNDESGHRRSSTPEHPPGIDDLDLELDEGSGGGTRWTRRRLLTTVGLGTAAILIGGGSLVTAIRSSKSNTGTISNEADKYGRTLNIGLASDPRGVDAAVVNQVWRHVARALSDSLVFLNPVTGELDPWLSTTWTVDDARIYTFELRQDVTFKDGTSLTGEVVKLNFESLRREGIHSSAKTIVAGIKEITVPSEYTVRVEFEKPNAAFLTSLSKAHAGIVSAATARSTVAERQKHVDGSGAFYLEEYVENQRIVLAKRADYDWAPAFFTHSGPAYLDEVVYKIIPEDSVRIGAIKGDKELQFIYWVNANYVNDLESAGVVIDDSARNQGTGTEWPLNTSSEILQDVRVRRALQAGLDRKAVAQIASGGIDIPAKGPLTEANPYFVDLSDHLVYDESKAHALLDEAGWTERGTDGIRIKDGKRLSLRAPSDEDEFQVAQEQWKKLGIELILDPPLAAEANEKLLSGEYDIAYWYHSFPDPDDLRANYGFTTGSNRSFLRESNRLDHLLQEQNTIIDPVARQKVVDEAARILVEDAYTVSVSQDVDVWAYSPRLHGLGANGLDQLLYDAWLEP